jgi:hypothetical protein
LFPFQFNFQVLAAKAVKYLKAKGLTQNYKEVYVASNYTTVDRNQENEVGTLTTESMIEEL